MKILIVGHKEHGKTEYTKALAEASGLKALSSSRVALELFLYDRVKDDYGYTSIEECWQDKYRCQEVRTRWYNEIQDFNRHNPTRLMEASYEQSDIYEGLRSRREFLSARQKGLFDLCVWVDASERKPLEDASSMTVLRSDADYVVDNNGPEFSLIARAQRLGRLLRTQQMK